MRALGVCMLSITLVFQAAIYEGRVEAGMWEQTEGENVAKEVPLAVIDPGELDVELDSKDCGKYFGSFLNSFVVVRYEKPKRAPEQLPPATEGGSEAGFEIGTYLPRQLKLLYATGYPSPTIELTQSGATIRLSPEDYDSARACLPTPSNERPMEGSC